MVPLKVDGGISGENVVPMPKSLLLFCIELPPLTAILLPLLLLLFGAIFVFIRFDKAGEAMLPPAVPPPNDNAPCGAICWCCCWG